MGVVPRSGESLRIQLEPCYWGGGYPAVWPRKQLVAMAQTEAEGTTYLKQKPHFYLVPVILSWAPHSRFARLNIVIDF